MVLQDVKKKFVRNALFGQTKTRVTSTLLSILLLYAWSLVCFFETCATKAAGPTMAGMAMTVLLFGSYHVFVLLLTSSAQEACNTKSKVKVQTLINVLVINQMCRLVNFPKSLSVTFSRQVQSCQTRFSTSGWFKKPPVLTRGKFPGVICPQTLYSSLKKG